MNDQGVGMANSVCTGCGGVEAHEGQAHSGQANPNVRRHFTHVRPR